MSNAIQLREVLSALHDNQLALATSIEELAKWADERGGADVVGHVRDCLDRLDRTQRTIVEGITTLPQ